MRRRHLAAAAAALALLATACGSSSGSGSSGGGGEADKAAQDIFNDAVAALTASASVHESQTGSDNSGSFSGTLDATKDTARVTAQSASQGKVVVVVVSGKVYVSQNDGAFQAVPDAQAAQFTYLVLSRFGACVSKQHGGLTKGATSTINGKNVIEIKDDGKAPGASPGSLFVSLDGAPRPVRVAQTGPTTTGGDPNCGYDPSSTTQSTTIDFDYTPSAPDITPPPGV